MIVKDIFWRIINKIDLYIRYIYILCFIKNADIILTATSAQTNLGDHAISIAARKFFKQSFKNLRVVEIPKELYIKYKGTIKHRVNRNAIVAITGGGFLGDLWMSEENLVRNVLSDFKDNKIVILPQTIFFTEKSNEYDKTFSTYKNVLELDINARDINSYDLLVQELPQNRVHFIPDMVLSLKYKKKRKRSDIALVCIRNDKENCISNEEMKSLLSILTDRITIKNTSNIMDHVVPIAFRRFYVNKKLNEIASAKIVITNRLHIMIFAAITGTPCIAIDNLSNKVSGVYHWIKQLPYIKMLNNFDDFKLFLNQLLKLDYCEYNGAIVAKYYSDLQKEFKVKNRC